MVGHFKLLILALIASLSLSAQYVQPMGYKDYSFWGQVNIGNNGAKLTHSSAYLELGKPTGSNKGLLFPRGNKDSIVSPTYGLTIYNIPDSSIYWYNGVQWKSVGTGSGGDHYPTTLAYASNILTLSRNGFIDLTVTLPFSSKLNIGDTSGKWVNIVYRRADSVFYLKGGVEYFAFKINAATWPGTSTDYIKGDGSVGTFATAVQAVGDLRYALLGHTHTYPQITNFQAGVIASISPGPGITISPAGVISASGQTVADGLISGGVVLWSGTGLIFDITAASYVIGGNQYASPTSQITLDAADGSYGRYDAIVVTNLGAVTKLTGTPSATPVFPQTDPATEILLTYVYVAAGATTPTQISNEVIYDENIEWSHSTSGSVTANFASTAFAEQGTKSISTTWTSSSNLIFTNGATLSSGNYTTISFYVRLSGTLTNSTNISTQFYNSTNAVSNSVTSSISKSTTGTWQLVSFNISQFSFTSTQFNSVRLILSGTTVGLAGTTTVYFDNIRLQAGITPPVTTQGLQSAYTKVTDGTTIAAANGSDQLKFRSADNKLTVAVGSNDATHGDNVLFTVNQANLSLSSIGGSLNVSQINATGGATTKVLSYDGTWVTNGGSTPTLQQVLTAGSSVTANNTITGSGGNLFKIEMGSTGSLDGILNVQGGATNLSSQYSAFRYAGIATTAGTGIGGNTVQLQAVNLSDAGGQVTQLNLYDDGRIYMNGFILLNVQYTPSSSSDTGKAVGTFTTDNDYLYYRAPSDGFWRRIAWTTF